MIAIGERPLGRGIVGTLIDRGNGRYSVRRHDGQILYVDENEHMTWYPEASAPDYPPHSYCTRSGKVLTYWPTGEIAVFFTLVER